MHTNENPGQTLCLPEHSAITLASRRSLKGLAFFAVATWVALASSASAGVIETQNLGTLSFAHPSAFFGDTETGAFTDIWKFTLTDGAQVATSLTSISITLTPAGSVGDITGFGATLSGAPLTSQDVTTQAGTITVNIQELFGGVAAAPGTYSLAVFGTGIGGGSTTNASYSGSIIINPSVSPVPEPATYLLTLAGLGMAGFAINRRSSAI